MTQGVWLGVCVLGVEMQWQKDALCSARTGHGSLSLLPKDCQASQPSPPYAPIPRYIHPKKSSSSRPATVKPLLCTVPVRERAALSSILPSHMLRVFRKMNCIISWPLGCMSHWQHDHVLNSGLPATSCFTRQNILGGLKTTRCCVMPVSRSARSFQIPKNPTALVRVKK